MLNPPAKTLPFQPKTGPGTNQGLRITHIRATASAGMSKAKSEYEKDYGEYVEGEDEIAHTYSSAEAAEEAILRKVLGE